MNTIDNLMALAPKEPRMKPDELRKLADALMSYRQCDEDGTECATSREAVHVAADYLRQQADAKPRGYLRNCHIAQRPSEASTDWIFYEDATGVYCQLDGYLVIPLEQAEAKPVARPRITQEWIDAEDAAGGVFAAGAAAEKKGKV